MVRSSNWSSGAIAAHAAEVSKARFDLLGTKRLKEANASYKQATAKLGQARLKHDENLAAGRKAKQQGLPDTGTPLREAREGYKQARGERGKAILGIGTRVVGAGGVTAAGLKGAQLYGSGGYGQQQVSGPPQQELGQGERMQPVQGQGRRTA